MGRANCVGPFLHADAHPPAYRAGKDESCLTKLIWVHARHPRGDKRENGREYDDLIEQVAAQLGRCIISPTPEREAALGRFIGEALRLRYGRLDDWVSRDDAIDLWWDVVETLRRALKAERILPGKLGGDAAVIERVLDVEMATMSRAHIVQMVDYYLACCRKA